eukprot:Phypoly_transcript_01094.p1 GENE.Phypoly_transcript_01094~~Phypoly_transcript_01094.p1  ORF type:complete len:919 (+),score=161.13 Phypoly_transcript_01094:935-3691(+)
MGDKGRIKVSSTDSPQPARRYKTQKEIEKEEDEIFQTLSPDFGREDFNPSKYVLENLPATVNVEYLDGVLEEKERVLDVVNNKLSALIMSSYGSFVQGMSQIHELGLDLQQSALMCNTSKTHLLSIQEGMTKGSLTILSKYNKRQVLGNIVEMMGKIKGLMADEATLKRLVSEGDYPAAIQKCLECQTTLGTLIQFRALQGMSTLFGEHYRLIQDRLDASLQQMCSTFPFSPISFQRVFSAYKLLGKADRMIERLTPFFVDTVETHAAKIVKTHVLLSEQNATKPEIFKQMPLRDLTQHIEEEHYLDCLRAVCEYLCDLIAAHTSMCAWLKGKKDADLAENGEKESEKERNFVRDLLTCLGKVTRNSWENMQRLLSLTFFGFRSTFKVEEFMRTLYCLHKMLSIGEEFARCKGEVLRQAILKQSKIYFEHYHAVRIEDLRTMLEHEMWHKCPLQPEFTVFDIKEFRQAVSRDTSDIGNTFTAPIFTIPDGKLEKLINEGNPFAKQPIAETANGTPAASQEAWWAIDSESETMAAEMQLRAEVIRKRFQKENGAGQQPTLTTTTINVVRFMGKYLLMMKLLPLPSVVWNGLISLYEYYVYTCVTFFTPGPSLEENAPYEVRSMLVHLQKVHGTSAIPASPSRDDGSGLKVPTRGAAVNEGLADPKQLWGLSFRVVAIESLLFLVDALRAAMPLVQTTLPTEKLDSMNQFFSDTLAIVPELRLQWYKGIAKTIINFESISTAIGNTKWDPKEIGLEHSPYVDTLLKEFRDVAKGTEALEIPPIPKRTLWESLVSNAMEALVEGYSRAKRCNNEGRAVMSLDLKVLLHSLEAIIPASAAPLSSSTRINPSHAAYVDNYIKAFYQPQNELVLFAKNHPEYTNKQICAILTSNVNSNLKKKQKQDLLNALEDVEKMRKRNDHH